MIETIDTIIQWHRETFPDATLEGQKKKWQEEYDEWNNTETETQEELCETADMIIVACGIARFNYMTGLYYLYRAMDLMWNVDTEKLWEAVESKMEKNRKRVWNKTGNGTYHHENGIED